MKQIRSLAFNTGQLLLIAWKEDKWHLLGYFLSTVLAAVFSIGAYFGYKFMIDAVFSSITLNKTTGAFFVILTYLFTQQISSYLYGILSQYYFDYIVRSKFQNALTRTFMQKLANLDFGHLEDGETRNLMARVQDSYPWRLPEIIQRVNFIFYNVVSLLLTIVIALQFHVG